MVEVRDNPQQNRFELEVDGQIVFARYARRSHDLAILHVEAPRALRGKGHADKLMRGIMEHARGQGLQVVPYCGYAAAWMRGNPQGVD
jgi:predicted GNAT family acetyltransferase